MVGPSSSRPDGTAFGPFPPSVTEGPIYQTIPRRWNDGLPPGWRTAGPAVIEEVESTTVVTPAFDVAVDAELNLVLTRRQA